MPIPSSDDSRPDTVNNSHGSRRISREIANLQQEIRDDFDQKLKELSSLMVRFKSLLANDNQLGTNLTGAANDETLADAKNTPDDEIIQLINKKMGDMPAQIPVLTDRVIDDPRIEKETNVESGKRTSRLKLVSNNDINSAEPLSPDNAAGSTSAEKPAKAVSRFTSEPARFESGLYQLNSQLYRFKLELDQELEFREEPLHIHFQHQSELAMVLQQITEKMQQEKNIGRQES